MLAQTRPNAHQLRNSGSAGMQYVQRSEQALVIDTRRSRAMRPNLSTRNGVSGRPTVERARWRTVGMPSATGHMVTDFFSMFAGTEAA